MHKTLFMFPGQGSQSLGMLSEIAEHYTVIVDTFAEASEALGFDLWSICQQGPVETLNNTEITQPAILTASIALWRLVSSSIQPEILAGHSLGEFSALVAAKVITLADAVKLVNLRGQYMQKAVPAGTGAMAAIIGLDDTAIINACEQNAGSEVVSAVNFNSPGQVVIAGNKAAVERTMIACKKAGAKRALPLPVSVPSHCALMRPAADQLAEQLSRVTFNKPVLPVINNVNVSCESQPDKIKTALIEQLYQPVRWSETILKAGNIYAVDRFYECGPGKVLTGLCKRILKGCDVASLDSLTTLSNVEL